MSHAHLNTKYSHLCGRHPSHFCLTSTCTLPVPTSFMPWIPASSLQLRYFFSLPTWPRNIGQGQEASVGIASSMACLVFAQPDSPLAWNCSHRLTLAHVTTLEQNSYPMPQAPAVKKSWSHNGPLSHSWLEVLNISPLCGENKRENFLAFPSHPRTLDLLWTHRRTIQHAWEEHGSQLVFYHLENLHKQDSDLEQTGVEMFYLVFFTCAF